MAMVYSCPGCGKGYELQLPDTWMLVCPSCQGHVYGETVKTTATKIPNDWNWLKIGSTGVFDEKKFYITGRVRIQTANEVLNIWCARSENKSIWISHSTDTMRVFGKYTAVFVDVNSNPVGEMIRISEKYSLRCQSKEECSLLHIEGEISEFPITNDRFEILKAGNTLGNSALLFKNAHKASPFLWGVVVDPGRMKFENTIVWDEWK